jgi:uncharacterized protein
MEIRRDIVDGVVDLLKKPVPIFQVLIGPRQVGKTTAAKQIIEQLGWMSHYASADSSSSLPPGPEWIENEWRAAMLKLDKSQGPLLIVFDEIQKIPRWTDAIKKLWDEHKSNERIKLLVLGSSAFLLKKGLTESLAGRFFLHRFPHWSFPECNQAFGWNLNQWLYFGGYPGAAQFMENETQWRQYVADSLIETVLFKDVFAMQTVTKPVLLRHLFNLAASYPAQILSYNKMIGQLQDAGNTTTLAHYVKLLESVFLLSGVESFSGGAIRMRGSSPKLILWNNALITASATKSFSECIGDSRWYGHLVENAVGAHLLNHLPPLQWNVSYWRKGDAEVDLVVTAGEKIYALEVKSGKVDASYNFREFKKDYPQAKSIRIGPNGINLETFFSTPPVQFLKNW